MGMRRTRCRAGTARRRDAGGTGPPLLVAAAARALDLASRGVRRLPLALRYLPADAVTLALGRLPTRLVRTAERNFATLLGVPATSRRARALARRSIRNFGRMSTDFLVLRASDGAELRAKAQLAGVEHFRDALRDGRGVIFALPHVGNWDAAAAILTELFDTRLTVVTEDDAAAALVARARSARGVALVPRGRSGRALLRALARKECVALVCDIPQAGTPRVDVPFFGKLAPFPTGPARLSQRAGAPILVITSVRLPGGRYLVAAQPPIRPAGRGPDGDAARLLTAEIAAGFERVIAEYPDQWYPFHRVWVE